MSNPETGQPAQISALTPLPRLEDLARSKAGGYEVDAVRDAFDAFRRHTLQLQAQLRVLQAAGKTGNVDPTGHAVRMDALHLIRAAAEFADVLERDAQTASAGQIRRTELEVRTRQRELQGREIEVERYKLETEKQRTEILNAAKNEARELRANAERDAAAELREAEARGTRLLEQSRHQATELTNAARAEVEQTLDWARAHASTSIARAQEAAEELLAAAGLGPEALAEVATAILAATRSTMDDAPPEPAVSEPALAAAPEPDAEPAVSEEPSSEPDAEETSPGDQPA